MTDARDLLRDLWRHGVRVELLADRFRLVPSGVAPDALRVMVREYADDIADLLALLPSPDRCEVCGDATRGPQGNTGLIHCVECALVVAERRGWRVLPMEHERAA